VGYQREAEKLPPGDRGGKLVQCSHTNVVENGQCHVVDRPLRGSMMSANYRPFFTALENVG
jgi:hypothetical protein